EGIHSYRGNAGLLVGVFALTLAVQAVRVLAIWMAGKAVGVELSPRPYYVMGPLLFLVLLVPFTVNGLAVRESFFVSFLGQLGVHADPAFATGFLFFVVNIALALPGLAIFLWESIRGVPRAPLHQSAVWRRRRRRPATAQPGRLATALGTRVPDALAALDRVSLSPQAGASLAHAEHVLRGRFRPQRGALRRLALRPLPARPARRRRRGWALR